MVVYRRVRNTRQKERLSHCPDYYSEVSKFTLTEQSEMRFLLCPQSHDGFATAKLRKIYEKNALFVWEYAKCAKSLTGRRLQGFPALAILSIFW